MRIPGLDEIVSTALQEEAAKLIVAGHVEEILAAYDKARVNGADEHEAALDGCRRMITHML